MSFGSFFATLRKNNNYTQQSLAEKLNVSNKTISAWENDYSTPDVSLIPKIAEMFHISCDELLNQKINEENIEEIKDNAKKNTNEYNSFRKKTYKTVIIILSSIILLLIASYIITVKSLVAGYDIYEDVVVNQIRYRKNDEGEYAVVGPTKKANRIEAVTLESTIKNHPVTTIEGYAFTGDTVESIILSENIKTISNSAFYQSRALKKVVLNEGLQNIETYAFFDCFRLEEINIPSTTTYIGSCAFSRTGLEKVTGGNGLKIIDNKAFYNCSSLKSVEILGDVKLVQTCFGCCINLVDAFFPNAVSIESYSFTNTNITILYLNKKVSLSQSVFFDRNVLKKVYYEGTAKEWEKRNYNDSYYGLNGVNGIDVIFDCSPESIKKTK